MLTPTSLVGNKTLSWLQGHLHKESKFLPLTHMENKKQNKLLVRVTVLKLPVTTVSHLIALETHYTKKSFSFLFAWFKKGELCWLTNPLAPRLICLSSTFIVLFFSQSFLFSTDKQWAKSIILKMRWCSSFQQPNWWFFSSIYVYFSFFHTPSKQVFVLLFTGEAFVCFVFVFWVRVEDSMEMLL